ncbi:molybdopterin-guanine dinucleotide biosynthesis protein B [Bacillus sp. B15-48]|nr:molybdopterin-guanine dinucleotide biosynthesis protein B [Bacillus sp. B15-48]
MVKSVIFQIVGYQDSGKTTMMIEVVKRLASEAYRVVTIKHHGHGGKPDLAEKKDSVRHVEAGALASLIEGEGRIVIQAEKTEWSLQEEIQWLSALNPDLVLIEGHKHANFPKAVLLRNERDVHLLEELQNIQVVYCRSTDLADSLKNSYPFPVITVVNDVHTWILEYVKTELENK